MWNGEGRPLLHVFGSLGRPDLWNENSSDTTQIKQKAKTYTRRWLFHLNSNMNLSLNFSVTIKNVVFLHSICMKANASESTDTLVMTSRFIGGLSLQRPSKLYKSKFQFNYFCLKKFLVVDISKDFSNTGFIICILNFIAAGSQVQIGILLFTND